jgi:hypothetical protein
MTPEFGAKILKVWETDISDPEDPRRIAEAELQILQARLSMP